MHLMRRTAAAALTAAAVLVVAVAVPAEASTTTVSAPAKRPPVPVASVTGLPSPRLDQDTTQTVTATGASRERAVSVSWGDDSAGSSGRTTCSAARAVSRPTSCTVTLTHEFAAVGTYTIVVRSGPRVIARTSVVVREAPRPWAPPAGWVQPAGWNVFRGGATYVPCSTVEWFYDRSTEPVTAVGMHDEIVGALTRLSAETGLTFVETTDSRRARLTYNFADISGQHGGAAGIGGRRSRVGYVTFSNTHWWPTDQWPGYDRVTQPDGSSAIGRGWLVVHETMHALGMDHVNDSTQIMNPIAGDAMALGGGDLDGLHTMYLNNPCPV